MCLIARKTSKQNTCISYLYKTLFTCTNTISGTFCVHNLPPGYPATYPTTRPVQYLRPVENGEAGGSNGLVQVR